MGRVVWLLVSVLLGTAALVHASGGRPDLAVTSVSVEQRGDSVRVTATIRNVGSVTAAASGASYYVGSTRAGGRRVRRLPPNANSRGTTLLTVPRSLRPGRYQLSACADRPGYVTESSERNNCREARDRVLVRDRTPPSFAGIVQATFCVPGPIRDDRTSRYALKWDRAQDDVTAAGAIAYDVYEAVTSRGEDFTRPTYSTRPGATSFATPPLPTNVGHYFVVRARDGAGNRDRNTVERQAVSICV